MSSNYWQTEVSGGLSGISLTGHMLAHQEMPVKILHNGETETVLGFIRVGASPDPSHDDSAVMISFALDSPSPKTLLLEADEPVVLHPDEYHRFPTD